MSSGFNDKEREAVYRVIRERRDVRRFKSDPIPGSILGRILTAAMQAPSVGYSQPWNFILVKDKVVRHRVHEAFLKANEEARKMFPAKGAKSTPP